MINRNEITQKQEGMGFIPRTMGTIEEMKKGMMEIMGQREEDRNGHRCKECSKGIMRSWGASRRYDVRRMSYERKWGTK